MHSISCGMSVAEETRGRERTDDESANSFSYLKSGLLVPVLSLLCSACVSSDQDGSAELAEHVVRDSAGVRIVENVSPSWTDENAWRLSDSAVVDIGGSEGHSGSELHRVRGAVALSDGRIVIANRGSMELLYFDAGGEYLMSAGREGDGPGEFQNMNWLIRSRGDSLVVFDRNLFRISMFDSQGQIQRNVTIQSVGEMLVQPVGLFGDGSILSFGTPIYGCMGAYRVEDFLFRHDTDGEFTDSLGVYPGGERFCRDLNPGPEMDGTPYFHRSSMYLAGSEHFYVATNDTYEIGVYSRTGNLVSLIRRQLIHLEVTEEAVNIIRERFVSARGPHPMRPQLEEFADARPIPATLPAYASINHDESGNLWVEEYRYPGDEVSRWTVFDADGVMLGTIQMPPGFSLFYAGESSVLGSWRDELDVEHVQKYELI